MLSSRTTAFIRTTILRIWSMIARPVTLSPSKLHDRHCAGSRSRNAKRRRFRVGYADRF